ncbi:MAG: hypothetical protein ACRC6K_01120 [Fusobacteriaceae bacterium]
MLEIFSNIFKTLFAKKEIAKVEKTEIKVKKKQKKKEVKETVVIQGKELRERCIKIKDKDKSEKKYISSSKLSKEDIKKWSEILLKEGQEEVLLGKNGKKLNGIALSNRIVKYLEMKKNCIHYKN